MNYTHLFLERFPDDKHILEINKIRIKGFLKFTFRAQKTDVASIKPKSARKIKSLNNLGFITFDSQEGIYMKAKNPSHIFGVQKWTDSLIDRGIKISFKIYHERAYCDAFIRTDILNVFRKNLKGENKRIKLLIHPSNGPFIALTKEYFKFDDGEEYHHLHTGIDATEEKEIDWHISNLSSECGYYTGPDFEEMSLDRTKWTYITVIDMKYGHHALKFNGLFRCIERALVSSLKVV